VASRLRSHIPGKHTFCARGAAAQSVRECIRSASCRPMNFNVISDLTACIHVGDLCELTLSGSNRGWRIVELLN
jgi:hypothetical protein